MKTGKELKALKISLINAPTEEDWISVKERALVTVGKTAVYISFQ